MRLTISILALLSALAAPLAVGAPASAPTVGDFLEQMQSAGPRAIVTYCGREVPTLKPQLEDEYQRFATKLVAAMAPLRERFAKKMAEPVPADAKNFEQLGAMMLDAARSHPPQSYCPWMMNRMKSTTSESLREVIEAQFARYEALGKQSQDAKQPQR